MEQPGAPEGLAVRALHPFHNIRVGRVIICYLLLWIGIFIGLDRFGLKISTDPLKDPLGSVWLALADLGIMALFLAYLLRRLLRYGLSWDRILGPPVAPSQLPRLLSFAAVQLGLAISLVALVQIAWPQSSEIFSRHPIYVPIGPGSLDLESYYLMLFNLVSALHVVIFAPICEELLFRGWMLQRLWLKWGSLPRAIWWSSLIFGLMHQQHLFGATCFALLMSALYLRTGNLRLNMLLHGFYNLCVLSLTIWMPRDFFLFSLPDWLDPIVFGGILLVTGLLYRRQLAALWPGSDTKAPLLEPEDFRRPEKPRRSGFRPADPKQMPLARLSVTAALLVLMVFQAGAILLSMPAVEALTRLDPAICGCFDRNAGIGHLSKPLVTLGLSSVLAFAVWLLCLSLAYRPLPPMPSLLKRTRLPAGSVPVLLALGWLMLCWRWLGSGPLKELHMLLSLDDPHIKLIGLSGMPLALLVGIVLLNVLLSSWLLQRIRQLIAYRCRSLAMMLFFALSAGLLIHAASPVTTLFVSIWLMLLSLQTEDQQPLLTLQAAYALLLWAVLLLPEVWMQGLYRLPFFPFVLLLGALLAFPLLLYRLMQTRAGVTAPGPDTELRVEALPAT